MDIKGTHARLFGYGVYEGEFVPPAEINEVFNDLQIPNPRLKLDSGQTVWGCECWWGDEEQFKHQLADLTVELVDIEIERGK